MGSKRPAELTDPLLRLGLSEKIRVLFFPVLLHWALITVPSGKIRVPGGGQGLEEAWMKNRMSKAQKVLLVIGTIALFAILPAAALGAGESSAGSRIHKAHLSIEASAPAIPGHGEPLTAERGERLWGLDDLEFSPDGSRVAFYSGRDETSHLVIVNVDGSERRVLIDQGLNWYPRWSPDGRWLVYTAPKTAGDQSDLDVFAIPVEEPGSPITLVGGPEREAEARWRPQR